MNSPASKPMHTGKTVHLDSHASATLQYIRDSMDAAGSLNVPGSAAISVGATGVFGALIASMPMLGRHWIAVWIIAALVAVTVGGTLLLRQFSTTSITSIFARGPVRKLMLCWAPTMFAAVAMTIVHWLSGNMDAVAGTWLLLYGCSLVSACAIMGKSMGVLGGAFVVLGAIALFVPPETHMIFLGVGFGGFHLLFGFYIRRATHGS